MSAPLHLPPVQRGQQGTRRRGVWWVADDISTYRVDRYPGVFRLQVRAGEQRGDRGEGGAPLRRAVPGGGAGRGAGALPGLLLPHRVGPGGGSARCHQQIHEVEVI